MQEDKKSPMKLAPLAAMAIAGAVQGGVQMFSGIRQRRNARAELKKQQAELDKRMAAYENFDFRVQNPYEDLTVPTEGQRLANEQIAQQTADTLGAMRAGTTGAGAAALATAISRQGVANARAAQASTAQQEARNQQLMLGAQFRIDQNVKQQEQGRIETLAALKQQDVATQQELLNKANQQIVEGGGQMLGSITQFAVGGGFDGKKTTNDDGVSTTDGTVNNTVDNTTDNTVNQGRTMGMQNPGNEITSSLYDEISFADLRNDPNFSHINDFNLAEMYDRYKVGGDLNNLTLGGVGGSGGLTLGKY